MNLNVLPLPADDRWIERLREGNYVWLVKEKEYARVVWAWEPPEPGCRKGRIAIDRYAIVVDTLHYKAGMQQTWWIGANGEGLDGKQLMLPCEGNLPDDPVSLPEISERQLRRALSDLQERVAKLERGSDMPWGLPGILGYNAEREALLNKFGW